MPTVSYANMMYDTRGCSSNKYGIVAATSACQRMQDAALLNPYNIVVARQSAMQPHLDGEASRWNSIQFMYHACYDTSACMRAPSGHCGEKLRLCGRCSARYARLRNPFARSQQDCMHAHLDAKTAAFVFSVTSIFFNPCAILDIIILCCTPPMLYALQHVQLFMQRTFCIPATLGASHSLSSFAESMHLSAQAMRRSELKIT